MSKLSIHLPNRLRLDIKLVRSRKTSESQPLLPDLAKILRIRKGSKFSRFFRHIFENDRMKRVLGYFMIITFVFSTVIAPRVRASNNETEIIFDNSEEDVMLKTEKARQFPVQNIRITQGFRFYHRGVDLDGVTGDPIRPIAEGKVIAISSTYWGYGNSILIEHKSGTRSLYAHLSKFNVKEGDEVEKDTIIGEMGATGRAFGDHLHLEIYDHDGSNLNPLVYLSS